jgi:cytochrome c oxidase subunit 2
VQDALVPHGPEAAAIAGLSWLLFIGGAAIFAVTMLACLLAWLGPEALRRTLARRGTILAGGIAFPVTALAALLPYTLGVHRAVAVPGGAELPPLRIEVEGRQFWWEVRYPDAGPDAITANEIRIPVGRPVELLLTSPDVIHSLWIPGLHGKMDMIPGRENRITLRAEREGVLRGICAEFCGVQHAWMALMVVVEPPARFEQWLARQSQPVEVPEDPALARGMAAFGRAGCGACHVVRGTSWRGRAGPDLSRIGSRLSLGAGMLENHRGTLGGWIGGTQELKPGALMPGFAAVLSGEELRDLAAWLESLR